MDKDDIRDDELIEKDITQVENVGPVLRSLGDMSNFYKDITNKLVTDGICFVCKKEIGDKKPFEIIKVPNHKLEKGLVAFVCTCKDCNTEE